MKHNTPIINKHLTGKDVEQCGNIGSNDNGDSIRDSKHSNIRDPSNEDVIQSTRQHDRFLSLLNEDEVLLLANSKIAATVEISEAQWTKEKLIDMICQNLAEVRIIIEYRGETRQIPKYSERIVDLVPKIAIFKPTPTLIINLSDLHPEILSKLYDFGKKQQKEILLDAGQRLFKIFYPYYFNMVANLVKVRIEP